MCERISLVQVLHMLMQYVTCQRQSMASTGVQMLQDLVHALGDHLEPQEWDLLLSLLQQACAKDLNPHIFRYLPDSCCHTKDLHHLL